MQVHLRRRVLVLTSTYPKQEGGSEPSFVYDLNRHLMKSCEVITLAPHYRGGLLKESTKAGQLFRYVYAPPILESLSYGGGILSNIKLKKWLLAVIPFFVMAQFLYALTIVFVKKVDVIHAHWVFPQGFVAAMIKLMRPSVRLVCTSHGGDLFGLRGRFFDKIFSFVIARSDVVTVVSNALKEFAVSRGAPDCKLKVIPMGVDVDLFHNLSRKDTPRQGLLFVGRLVEKKGVLELIHAAAMLRDEGVAFDLAIAGGGPLYDDCVGLIKGYKLSEQVHMLGSVGKKDLPALYGERQICVVPSVVDSRGDQEGLGLVIVEALSSGCVVLASDMPAIRDVIRNGENGILVPAGKPEAIRDGLKTLLENSSLQERLSAGARESVVGKFDLSSVSARYADVLLVK